MRRSRQLLLPSFVLAGTRPKRAAGLAATHALGKSASVPYVRAVISSQLGRTVGTSTSTFAATARSSRPAVRILVGLRHDIRKKLAWRVVSRPLPPCRRPTAKFGGRRRDQKRGRGKKLRSHAAGTVT
ncbi:MAG: hypothetical protein BJ554DRAFT_7769 [Olpidium bornovanus]|uniref:Uncharacterized protein n=1 Tax=Olpidium bornovanus TaxID=278681 RepID=A0A8H8DM58_9FUNG|nr:MAG: hypothetical protein BJ554DRAFT_7769 [Olpidium bornovanus]